MPKKERAKKSALRKKTRRIQVCNAVMHNALRAAAAVVVACAATATAGASKWLLPSGFSLPLQHCLLLARSPGACLVAANLLPVT